MKVMDDVMLIKDRERYKNENVTSGMIGTIISAEIRENEFLVCFCDQRTLSKNFIWNEENVKNIKKDIVISVNIKDLKVVKDGGTTDDDILEDIPKNNPAWWCKVEDGYIVNLLGEKKNKIPYDYES